MGLNRNDWLVFASVWMIGMACLGIGLLVAPLFLPQENAWTSKGTGTALLLVAASILFVAVFEGKGTLVQIAGALTAVFGYAGTIKVLGSENSLLMAVIFVVTFYTGLIGMFSVWIAWMGRNVFSGRS